MRDLLYRHEPPRYERGPYSDGSFSMDFSRVTLLLGAPRSGTSWIGKIFDSHPDVLYRHEPDLALWEQKLPFLVLPEQTATYSGLARDYLDRLIRTPTLKASGQLPVFPKAYAFPGVQTARAAMIHGLRWLEAVSGRRGLRAAPIPDLFRLESYPPLRVVMKSVSALGRSRILLEAMPQARFIFIMRHPCGQIGSMLRGQRQGRFESGLFIKEALRIPLARRYGLTEADLDRASESARRAWVWVLMNEFALEAFAGRENARIVIYEDVCEDPLARAREMFSFSHLPWHEQTETFIRHSTTHSGKERYYGVLRNAVASANKWRTELNQQDQETIRQIVRQTSLAQYWPDIAESVPDKQLTSA